ncbi:MAG: hypothetical protein NE330_05850 [Lentisphaeraceae bacterium]|nr:hypothetical protein [Lentisphaeraceae bacterium]
MKKLSLIPLFTLLLFSCASSPYVGKWQAKDNGKVYLLNIEDSGDVLANWQDMSGQNHSRNGTWKKNDDGSIQVDGVNAKASAKMVDGKLEFKSRQNTIKFDKLPASN